MKKQTQKIPAFKDFLFQWEDLGIYKCPFGDAKKKKKVLEEF